MYKLRNLSSGNQDIIKTDEMIYIPMVDGNSDYEEYKEWINEGNEPSPAD